MKKPIFLAALFLPVFTFSQTFCGFTCSDCLNKLFVGSNKIITISNLSYASPTISNDYVDYQISKDGCIIDSVCLYGNDAAENSLVYDVLYPDLSCGTYPLLPAVILFHGGGFSECTNKTGIEDYAKDFARRGFVAFSVEYRRGKIADNSSLTASYVLALYRGLQDARGAIRTIIKRQNEGTQPYRIDVNKIFIGGASEGGVIALNTAYLNQKQIDKVLPGASALLGSVNASFPTPPYYYGEPSIDYTIRGVFNLWGGLAEADKNGSPAGFIEPGEPPFIGFHGKLDGTVSYTAELKTFSTGDKASVEQCDDIQYTNPEAGKTIWLLGSRAVYDECKSQNICAEVYIDSNMGHGPGDDPNPLALPYTKISKVKDYIVQRTASFFQAVLCGKCNEIATSLFVDCVNVRCQSANLNDLADVNNCSMFRQSTETNPDEPEWKIFNTGSVVEIIFYNRQYAAIELFNAWGQKIKSLNGTFDRAGIPVSSLSQGIYLIRISTETESRTQQIFLNGSK